MGDKYFQDKIILLGGVSVLTKIINTCCTQNSQINIEFWQFWV